MINGQQEACKTCGRKPLDCAKPENRNCAATRVGLQLGSLPREEQTRPLQQGLSVSETMKRIKAGLKEGWSGWEWEQNLKGEKRDG
jgi:hypothetical protein